MPLTQRPGSPPGLLSLACSNDTNAIAAGTELANHQASIIIWYVLSRPFPPASIPIRPTIPTNKPPKGPPLPFLSQNPIQRHPLGRHHRGSSASPVNPFFFLPSIILTDLLLPLTSSPNQLSYNRAQPTLLLSGSTDGIVSVTDTSVADEDEAVVQAFNHGSVHRAGFLNATEVYAASHDEKFALYDTAEHAATGAATLDLGDVRPALGCQYLAGVTAKLDGLGAVLGVGSQE